MVAPLVLSKKKLIDTAEHAIANRGIVGLVLTKDTSDTASAIAGGIPIPDVTSTPDAAPVPEADKPTGINALNGFGTVVRIIKKLNTSDGGMTVMVHSLKRFKIVKVVREEPFMVVQVDYRDDIIEKSIELDALVRLVISQVKKLSESTPFFTEEMKLAMLNAPGPGALADLVAFALSLKREDAQDFLETTVVRQRFEKLFVSS
jgi:ATP-dependent Lon protease